MADLEYQAKLNIDDILKGLVQVDKQTEATAKRIDAHFRKAGKSIDGLFVDANGRIREANGRFSQMGNAAAKAGQQTSDSFSVAGIKMGAVAGVVTSLTTELINLGKAGVQALIDIGKQSVQTAIEIDTLKARLAGIFDGSKEAADQAFTFIQDKSKELGFDLSELAGAFIPKTESLQQFERVAKIATALARSDPEQGAIGARIALIEALSGTFTSLQRRFEIPKDDIDALKEAFDKEGIEGFLGAFEDVLDKSGKSFEDFSDTASTAFAKLQISGEQLGGRLGTPILQALEDAANKINEFIGANEDELIVFADTIGRAIADAIDYLSSIDLSQLDTDQLIEFADYVFRLVNAVQLISNELIGFAQAVFQVTDAVTPLGEILDYLGYLFSNVDRALITGTQILAIAKAGYIGLYEGIQPVVEILGQLYDAASKATAGDFTGAADALNAALEKSTQDLFDEVAAREAANAAILESQQRIEDYQKSVQDNADKQATLRQELEETATAGTDAADAIMAAGAAERQAAEDADELAAAQDKVNKAMADAAQDFQRKLEDIDIESERKRLDITIEFAQKREDAARDNVRKLEDIREKYADDVADAQLDLERKEEDIARKFGQERIDQEKDRREKRLEIERDYRLKLQDIQRQFLLDADEAESKRDAVAFLRALKERDQKVQDAQLDRVREIDELRISNQQKTEELRLQQQGELEEARIANERKIEDLRTNLDRQIEEQNENYSQQLEDLSTAEQRKNEELNRWREREIEDAKLAYDRKLEDLRASLAAELALIEQFAAAKAAAEASAGTQSVSSPSSRPSTTAGASAGFGANPGTIGGGGSSSGGRFSSVGRRASGGPVMRGYPYMVGEAGKELFVPNQSGRIVPNSALTLPNFGRANAVSNNTYNNQKTASLGGMIDPGSLDAILQSKLENTLVRLLDKMG